MVLISFGLSNYSVNSIPSLYEEGGDMLLGIFSVARESAGDRDQHHRQTFSRHVL